MTFEPEEKPLADAELEMVVQVIRRGLKEGARIENLEDRLVAMAAAIKEASRRLKEMNRIGQEICRNYQRAIDPQRKQALTLAEEVERARWITEKSDELKRQLN